MTRRLFSFKLNISFLTAKLAVKKDMQKSAYFEWLPYCSGGGDTQKKPGTRWSVRRIGGGYLLFHFRSIIGVARFNFSVRNGKRWSPCAMATLVSFCTAVSSIRLLVPSGTLAGVEGGKRVLEAVRASRILTSERGGGTRRRTRPAGPVLILGGLRPGKGLGD